jgi:hypothetical protein
MKRNNLIPAITLGLVISAGFYNTSMASTLLFEPKNPAFFSNTNNASIGQLMNSVRRPEAPTPSTPALSTADIIQQGVLSQISTKINNDIFNTSNPTGSYDLGNGNRVSFVRTGGNVVITIINATTGTTVITVPDI